ncbi:MAG: S1 RNA-binding domain-containing protein [Oscillatoriales cyanobacterium SM2_2_1]|nr:S1 RNA-binding domain-containing protein [Oscillatoriales cyanobacterium SM2_2_1]
MTDRKNVSSFSAADFANALAQHDYEFNVGQVITGKVVSHDTTGVFLDVGAKSLAFLPTDEITPRYAKDLAGRLPIGSEHRFVVTSGQNEDGEIKVSLRQLLIRQAWEKAREYLAEQKIFDSRVLDHNSGGVVVSVAGLRGFVPRSHLVDRGDLATLVDKMLSVVILELDEERERIICSNRQASRVSAFGQISKGQILDGEIASLRAYGAFVQLPGLTGLLHVKEISAKPIGDVAAFFQIGEPVRVVAIDVDESRQRVSLSTKILELHDGEMLDNRAQIFAEAEARLEKNIAKLWDAAAS